jgi:hypothetical protein
MYDPMSPMIQKGLQKALAQLYKKARIGPMPRMIKIQVAKGRGRLASDENLKKGLIRLAHDNPELRPHLLPLLKTANTKEVAEQTEKFLHGFASEVKRVRKVNEDTVKKEFLSRFKKEGKNPDDYDWEDSASLEAMERTKNDFVKDSSFHGQYASTDLGSFVDSILDEKGSDYRKHPLMKESLYGIGEVFEEQLTPKFPKLKTEADVVLDQIFDLPHKEGVKEMSYAKKSTPQLDLDQEVASPKGNRKIKLRTLKDKYPEVFKKKYQKYQR